MVHLLSQYLGNYTTEKVKARSVELLYSWSKGLGHEPKIAEAYSMLKKQGIVTDDPQHVDQVMKLLHLAWTKLVMAWTNFLEKSYSQYFQNWS